MKFGQMYFCEGVALFVHAALIFFIKGILTYSVLFRFFT